KIRKAHKKKIWAIKIYKKNNKKIQTKKRIINAVKCIKFRVDFFIPSSFIIEKKSLIHFYDIRILKISKCFIFRE
ncbi:hypothetical protein CO033_02085, partial [Candidatus Nomurabacteria bacterium CG_4_9_14_0_2_um_filter_32_10]